MTTRLTATGIVYPDGTSDTNNFATRQSQMLGGDYGSHVLAQLRSYDDGSTGSTFPGSSLYVANCGTFGQNNTGWTNQTLPGSWRCMGDICSSNGNRLNKALTYWDCRTTIWLRYA